MHATPLPLTDIDADALPRDRTLPDDDAMDDLARSIANIGLRQPIEVWALQTQRPPFRFGLISGYRRLAACRALGLPTIPAFLRTPDTLGQAMAEMVAENEVRTQITPWEKGRLILTTVEEGHFDTPDAAIAALYPLQSRQGRTRLRSLALVVEVLAPYLSTPESLSISRMEHLAAALRAGGEGMIIATLTTTAPRATCGLATQWAALAPVLAEALLPPDAAASAIPDRPRRLLHLKQGLTIRRELTRTGYILRFSGPEARKGGLLDDVLDHGERWFQKE